MIQEETEDELRMALPFLLRIVWLRIISMKCTKTKYYILTFLLRLTSHFDYCGIVRDQISDYSYDPICAALARNCRNY